MGHLVFFFLQKQKTNWFNIFSFIQDMIVLVNGGMDKVIHIFQYPSLFKWEWWGCFGKRDTQKDDL